MRDVMRDALGGVVAAALALALGLAAAGCQLIEPAGGETQEAVDGPWARPGSGQDLYGMYCASCHGLGAQGDGPVAAGLEDAPPDLTRIAARRGGTFPENEILRVVLGTDPLVAHGTRDMPVWGRRFSAGQPPGPATASQSRGRAMLIVNYLKSIQQPPLP